MAFAILSATNLCLRGSKKKWRSGTGKDDVAGLPFSEKKICDVCIVCIKCYYYM